MAPRPAVLLDVDGTLVDSNYLHVHAWQMAFAELGRTVESWRIHKLIGMDGDSLIAELAQKDIRDQAKELHSQFYAGFVSSLRPLPGARALLDGIAEVGLQVVLASSAPEDELATCRKLLDRDDIVSAVTSANDVDTAKPEPGIVEVALERAGVDAEQAVFVGDSVWDVRAAGRAGVKCIGLLSGGIPRDVLLSEGAATVWENPQELLNHLGESPIAQLTTLGSA
jgi:HAD superfamily hydrolase (TIGR01509 family)